MKNNDNNLDAFRAEWRRYGESFDYGPSPKLTFATGPVARPWLQPAALVVAWLLITITAVKWIPSADYYNVTGSAAPDVAINYVQSILEVV